jgi:hypothetical protein
MSSAAGQCQTSAVLVPGGKANFGKEAAAHDAAVIATHPTWVKLTYMSGGQKLASGVTTGWYNNAPYKTGCANKKSTQQCDEYPLYATSEGGPNAWNLAGSDVLRPVLTADNRTEGLAYSAMITTTACNMESATANGSGGGTGGTSFLVVPVPTLAVPSFFICGQSGDAG